MRAAQYRPNAYTVTALFACACTCLAGLLLCGCDRAWSDDTVRGAIEDRNEWPDAFSRVYYRIVSANPDASVECFLLHGKPGKFSVDDALFRVSNATPLVFEALSDELNLVSTPTDLHRESRHHSGLIPPPSDWWAIPESSTSEHFVSRHRLEGGEGDLYYVTLEREEGMVYIDYYFNF